MQAQLDVGEIGGSARVQTVSIGNGLLYDLLKQFYARTGVPVLLNISLNVNGELIVETPEDAWRCLFTTPLTFCQIDKQLLTKSKPDLALLDFRPCSTLKRHQLNHQEASD